MIETWKKQFTLQQLSLEHDEPIIFVTSQWQKEKKASIFYLIYRWIVALIFFVTFIVSVADVNHPDTSPEFKAKWWIYLTDWGYTACTFQTLLGSLMLSIYFLAPDLQKAISILYKPYWASNVIATDISFGITTLYWSIIYNEKTMALDAMNFFVHANNSILMMIDLFVVAHPIRLLHCCYPIVFGVCYAVFSVIFYAAGGISREGKTYIYTILDWSKPGITSAVCIAVLGFIVIVHAISWGLHKFRLWMHSKYFAKEAIDSKKDASGMAYVNEAMAVDEENRV